MDKIYVITVKSEKDFDTNEVKKAIDLALDMRLNTSLEYHVYIAATKEL